ncbi:hypothetical protein NM208_g6769 [Fusarium decemcellulare]|uniref:Uncharacterized protein n=1 Tax=Fusarium decemcellulare TaxID=57161 RepID=A0ACC1SBQ2_9HYPO|nr:hypothetical protein NM208_g6769 [Fusarium decemcellulare]
MAIHDVLKLARAITKLASTENMNKAIAAAGKKVDDLFEYVVGGITKDVEACFVCQLASLVLANSRSPLISPESSPAPFSSSKVKPRQLSFGQLLLATLG